MCFSFAIKTRSKNWLTTANTGTTSTVHFLFALGGQRRFRVINDSADGEASRQAMTAELLSSVVTFFRNSRRSNVPYRLLLAKHAS